jgi:phenylacetate-CoA ligase
LGTRENRGVLHNVDPLFFLEVIDWETGEHVEDGQQGEIVLTSLTHDEVPLIRCAMGDVAIYRAPNTCGCGRSFSGVEIGSITRRDDMVKVKGINVWPQAADDALNQINEVDEYQIVVSNDEFASDVVTARIMPKSTLTPEGVESLVSGVAGKLQGRIGIRFAVEVLETGSIARSEYKARRWIDNRGRKDP